MSKECILSILLKRLGKAIPPFDILRFDIRYSPRPELAAGCGSL